jgi:hypothetical protein
LPVGANISKAAERNKKRRAKSNKNSEKDQHSHGKDPASSNPKQQQQPQQSEPQVDDDEWLEDEEDADTIMEVQLDRMAGEEDSAQEFHSVLELSSGATISKKRIKITKEILQNNDVWTLRPMDRQKLYRHWITQFYKKEQALFSYVDFFIYLSLGGQFIATIMPTIRRTMP